MKKTTVLLMISLALPLIASAQAGIGLGIKGGANFANVDMKDVDTKSITSYHVGGYVNLNLSKSFGITPEVLFSALGSEIDNVKVNTSYISIPIMVRIMPVKFLSLQAGPQFSFLTKAKSEDFDDIKDQFKNNDFGVAFGAGLHLPMGFNVGARYVLGFTNINDVSEEEIKNRTFQVYLGWTILGAK